MEGLHTTSAMDGQGIALAEDGCMALIEVEQRAGLASRLATGVPDIGTRADSCTASGEECGCIGLKIAVHRQTAFDDLSLGTKK